jgi:hypothetical protein
MSLDTATTEFEETETIGSPKGTLLDILAEGNPYVFITVPGGSEAGTLNLTLDHNAPVGSADLIGYVLKAALKALENQNPE